MNDRPTTPTESGASAAGHAPGGRAADAVAVADPPAGPAKAEVCAAGAYQPQRCTWGLGPL